MSGARLEKTGGVFAGIRRGFFRAENDADASRSFAAVQWYDSDRLLARIIHEHFCCKRRSTVTIGLWPAGSPLGPATYCWGLAPFVLAPVPV